MKMLNFFFRFHIFLAELSDAFARQLTWLFSTRALDDLPASRVGNSVTNSTDTIFELKILAQKARAKIPIDVQK